MMISNYSFSIYLLHSYFLISGYLLEGYLRSMPLPVAILLLFLICTLGPIFVSWVCNHFRYGYLFVGKVYQPKQTKEIRRRIKAAQSEKRRRFSRLL